MDTVTVQTTTDKLLAHKEGAIGWITFNNPARHNAVSMSMWESVPRALDAFEQDPDIRLVILKGAGEKAFVSGADISEFKEKRASKEAAEAYNAAGEACHRALQEFPKPTIAMIRGYCIGGGCAVAIDCDIRIAAEDSVYAIPAGRLGLGYRYEGIRRLIDLVGPSFAAEIFFTARKFNAQEALAMSLINRLVPVAELESYTRGYAGMIADNAPLTLAAVKRSVLERHKDPSVRDLKRCNDMVDACFASRDYEEGRSAFMEKRRPVFKGR
ncbi:MAG: enoyl-CoA hydratase/isomerase family protein [Burkholderiales bacterium]|nr:enoyl-CoA hydratase/isomerase family protein [Burkholderiales bacterium]